MGELFQSMAKAHSHVPYKGARRRLDRHLSGQIHLSFDQVTSSGPQIKAGARWR
jgi:tripartite-type tricarboxylate transporter receptor subunit TctC